VLGLALLWKGYSESLLFEFVCDRVEGSDAGFESCLFHVLLVDQVDGHLTVLRTSLHSHRGPQDEVHTQEKMI